MFIGKCRCKDSSLCPDESYQNMVMSAKTSAEVVIDGKVYTLSGYEGEEYLQKVASYINGKINEFTSIEEYRHIPLNMKNTLIQLNIADDYFKAKDQVGKN